jgi:DNA-binding response OmpR family regulator
MEEVRPGKILVVKTNEGFRSSLCEFLQNLGYQVTGTNITEQAVKIALIKIPDLIFIDLSEDKALEIIYEFRQKDELAGVPVLASSANGGFGIELFSNIDKFGNGFIGYITKPVNFNDLAEQISSILAKRKKRRKNHKRPLFLY